MGAMARIVRAFLLVGGLCLGSQAAWAHGGIKTVRVSTEDQIVNAMLAANASGKPTIIRVARGQYHFNTAFPSEFGSSVLPPVTGKILIVAHDPEDSVFQPGEFAFGRIFTVLAGGSLVVQNLGLTGSVIVCDLDREDCDRGGGAAAANIGGLMWFLNCFISGNIAAVQDVGETVRGGAIVSTDGELRLEDTTIAGNSALGYGGGIALWNGKATLVRSVVRGNRLGTSAFGGFALGAGIYAEGTRLTLIGSTVSGNFLSEDDGLVTLGGGIHNSGGVLKIIDSAVTENGTVWGGAGGGIFNTGSLFVKNSTLGDNKTGRVGGAIFNSGQLVLESVTILRNEANGFDGATQGSRTPPFPFNCRRGDDVSGCIQGGGGIWNDPSGSVRIQSSVIAENTSLSAASDCNSPLHSNGHNALGVSPDCHFQNLRVSDQVNIDARLGELTDDGDAGDAHYPILVGSPLIDTGGKVLQQCSVRDQIGSRRRDGNRDGLVRCDVGAVEFRAGNH